MTKLDLTKNVVSTIVGLGTTRVVSSIMKNNTDPETVTDQVTMYSSSVVLGMMAADATRQYTNAKIDAAAAWYRENVKSN